MTSGEGSAPARANASASATFARDSVSTSFRVASSTPAATSRARWAGSGAIEGDSNPQLPAPVRVSEWHRRTVIKCGFVQESTVLIPQRGLRHGANRERIPNELIYVMRRAS